MPTAAPRIPRDMTTWHAPKEGCCPDAGIPGEGRCFQFAGASSF